MSANMFQITKGIEPQPWKMCIYGTPGVGKTYLASTLPDALIVDLEDGSGLTQASRIHVKTYSQFLQVIKWIGEDSANDVYKTIVIDTCTALELMIVEHVTGKNGWETLASPAYGAGTVALVAEWKRCMRCLDFLTTHRKNVLFLAHSRIASFASPMTENYDRYEPDINKKMLPYFMSAFDAVLFYHWQVLVKANSNSNQQKPDKTAHAQRRELHTQEKASAVAKCRFGFPEVVRDPTAELFAKLGIQGNAGNQSQRPPANTSTRPHIVPIPLAADEEDVP